MRSRTADDLINATNDVISLASDILRKVDLGICSISDETYTIEEQNERYAVEFLTIAEPIINKLKSDPAYFEKMKQKYGMTT